MHQWFFSTRFRRMHGQDGGEAGIDNGFAARCTVKPVMIEPTSVSPPKELFE
jgi:hypothetical protein